MSGDPYPAGDLPERALLTQFLDLYREVMVNKVAGLDDERLRRHLVPSQTTLLGLVKHLAHVERWWFQVAFAAEAEPVYDPDDEDADFRVEPQESTEEIVARYQAACERSREIAAAAALEDTCKFSGQTHRTLRWVLVHMIDETARHAGHADILREQLDGATGFVGA